MTLDSESRSTVSSDAAGAATATITLDGKTVTMPVNPGDTVLETARRAGLAPPFSCEAGNCGTCIATITEGVVKMRANEVLDQGDIDDGLVLTCQGVPETDVTITYDD
jgi:ferredoxin